jgi:hypothetical protein
MRYEVHVSGEISPEELGPELGTLAERPAMVHERCTVVHARLPDQAALHGLLHQLWGRRLHVVRVRRTPG